MVFSRQKRADANMNSQYLDSMHKTLARSSKTNAQHGQRLGGHEIPSLAEELLAFNSC